MKAKNMDKDCNHEPCKYGPQFYEDMGKDAYVSQHKKCKKCGKIIRIILHLPEDIALCVGDVSSFYLHLADYIDELAKKYGYVYNEKGDTENSLCITYEVPQEDLDDC